MAVSNVARRDHFGDACGGLLEGPSARRLVLRHHLRGDLVDSDRAPPPRRRASYRR